MNCTIRCLQTDTIESLLAGQLPPEELAATEEHLSQCNTCRWRIESAIGSSQWWEEVRESLAPGDQDAPGDRGSRNTQQSGSQTDQLLELLGPSEDPRMLGRIGSYEIVGLIGRGGMGVVFKGFDAPLNRFVAIKMLLPHLAHSGVARKRFAREAQAAAAVVDDHVMPIHCVSEWQGIPYFVMTYSRGMSLQKRLDKEGPLELREILRIGLQTATGLAAAHTQGLVHRDVKPANIMLDESVERVALVDFGLARAVDDASLTHSGTLAGTPQYMSPEQARGEAVDQRSDLFSLGSVLYAMCTGYAPFRAETSYGVLRRITDDEPRPIRQINPDTPEWLCRIIGRLMAKQPADRFQSARKVAELLEQCLAHIQQPDAVALPVQLRDSRSSISAPPRRWSIRRVLAGAAFALAVLWAGVVIVLETNKGTLTIESDADDVSLRITQGDKVVEKLTVTQAGKNVRIAAGTYVLEIDGKADGIAVKDRNVTIERGGTEIVKIVQRDAADTAASDRIEMRANTRRGNPGETRLWNQLGVTPAPVSALTAKVLEWIGLHLSPIKKDQFRDKNVFSKYPGGLDVTFVRTHGPAEKAGFREDEILVELQERVVLDLEALDAAMQDAVEQIQRGDANSLQFDVLRGGETVRVNVPFPAREFNLRTSDNAERIAKHVAARIMELKNKYPHLAKFSAAEHLKKNDVRNNFPPGTPINPELYSITYQNGVVVTVPARKITFDPQIGGIQLNVHFFRGDSRGADLTPPYRIGDLSIHVYAKGPAAEAIRGEIVRILEGFGAEKRPPVGATETPSAPPMPTHPPTNGDLLVELSGSWDVRQTYHEDALQTASLVAKVEGHRMHLSSPDGSNPMTFEFSLGSAGPPQQVDLHPVIGPSDAADMQASGLTPEQVNPTFLGILEKTSSGIRMCTEAVPGGRRPTDFAGGPDRVVWQFSRPTSKGKASRRAASDAVAVTAPAPPVTFDPEAVRSAKLEYQTARQQLKIAENHHKKVRDHKSADVIERARRRLRSAEQTLEAAQRRLELQITLVEQTLKEAQAELEIETVKCEELEELLSKKLVGRLEVLEQQLAMQKAEHRVQRIRELLNWLKGSPQTDGETGEDRASGGPGEALAPEPAAVTPAEPPVAFDPDVVRSAKLEFEEARQELKTAEDHHEKVQDHKSADVTERAQRGLRHAEQRLEAAQRRLELQITLVEQTLKEAQAELEIETVKCEELQELSKKLVGRLEVLEQQLAMQKAEHRIERIRELLNWLKGPPQIDGETGEDRSSGGPGEALAPEPAAVTPAEPPVAFDPDVVRSAKLEFKEARPPQLVAG